MIYSTSSGRRSNQVQQGAVNVPNNVPSVTAQQARDIAANIKLRKMLKKTRPQISAMGVSLVTVNGARQDVQHRDNEQEGSAQINAEKRDAD